MNLAKIGRLLLRLGSIHSIFEKGNCSIFNSCNLKWLVKSKARRVTND